VSVVAGTELTFLHIYNLEQDFDGGVLEASTNGGTSWSDMRVNITSGGYNGVISDVFNNPLHGRLAWTGNSGGYTRVAVNLTPYAGHDLLFRFRLGTDDSLAALGWYIDHITVGSSTCPTSTPGGPTETAATSTATGTSVAATGTTVASTSTAIVTGTATSCANLPINGSLTLNDPTQAGRLNTLLAASSCDDPRGCPGALDPLPRHYDAYTFVNTSSSEACFTVNVTAACLDEILIHSSTYLDSFDPQNLCLNYLADVGPGILTNSQYSFTVPAGARFVVVVNELAPNLLCPNYTLTVTGPACPVPSTPAPTSTPILPEITVTAIPTLETCQVQFSDVQAGDTFYSQIMCLACNGLMSGYSDGTFRPYNEVTRGQLAKIVSLASGFNEPIDTQTFEDVPVGSTFHQYVERMASRGIVGGYECGTVETEPCGPDNKPYFRPNANANRGQISKIIATAAQLNGIFGADGSPGEEGQMFEDVSSTNTFYAWVQMLASHGMIGGYPCGGEGEPCGPTNMPYFRTYNNANRGQASKIVANTYYPTCQLR
jgi:hypothetical protein